MWFLDMILVVSLRTSERASEASGDCSRERGVLKRARAVWKQYLSQLRGITLRCHSDGQVKR
jgi:hypothetical protein